MLPYYSNSFHVDQDIFRDISNDYNTSCLFYSEDQDVVSRFKECAIPADHILELGSAVISTIGAIIGLYNILKGQAHGKKFRIKHVLSIKDTYYEMDEFEGDIEDYKAVLQELEYQSKTLQRK